MRFASTCEAGQGQEGGRREPTRPEQAADVLRILERGRTTTREQVGEDPSAGEVRPNRGRITIRSRFISLLTCCTCGAASRITSSSYCGAGPD